jgi:serine/threonine protein kinase
MTDHGYFVDWEDDDNLDDIEENAEPASFYSDASIYYPIHIGQVLAQKYRIEHKLGHGGFSTVWMAHNIQTSQDVALKICTVTSDTVNREWNMHNEIRARVKDTSNLLLSFEIFFITASRGHHTVLVFPLRGPNLQSCLVNLSMADRMSAAKQTLEALKQLHDAKIVHRG